MTEKHCPVCNSVVYGRCAAKRYCSERCKNRAAYERLHPDAARRVSVCQVCGRNLPDGCASNRRFCSGACRAKDWYHTHSTAQTRRVKASKTSRRRQRLMAKWNALFAAKVR